MFKYLTAYTIYTSCISGLMLDEGKENACPHCESGSFVKKGKKYSCIKGVWVQRYKCNECGRKFSRRLKRIEKPEPFVYQSKPVPSQDWPAYTEAQKSEKLLLMSTLREMLDYLEIKEHARVGRPSVDFKDMAFSIILKTYTGLSSRRLASDLEIAKQQGFINKVYDFTVLMDYMRDSRMQRIFEELYKLAALSVKPIESDFAVDSSGFSTSQFGRWFDHKWGKEVERREWVKAHIMVGTITNAITSIEITEGTAADSPRYEKLVKDTAKGFNVKEVSADKAYLSRKNLEVTVNLNAVPLIPFKENSVGRARGSAVWKKMYNYFQNHKQEFMERYHKRSNVESTFNMMKQKFGSTLKTKTFQGQKNELLAMAVCHNICVIIQEYHENNIERGLPTEALENGRRMIF